MATVKTTINVDEETWNRFKRSVTSRYGSIRSLSDAVEEAIKCFNIEELLEMFVKQAGIEVESYPSLREVEERRPKLATSAGEEVRAMREERVASISGHQ